MVNSIPKKIKFFVLFPSFSPLRIYRYENFVFKNIFHNKKSSGENNNINNFEENPYYNEKEKEERVNIEEFFLSKKINFSKFLQKIDDLITKLFLSLYPEMLKNCLKTLIYTNNAFQIFEVNFILLEDNQPYFLEINNFNLNSSFNTHDEKITFLSQVFNLVGLFSKVRDRNLIMKSNQFFFDFPNHKLFQQKSFEKNIEIDICSEIFFEYERKQNFSLLYPNKNFEKYNYLFENKQKYDKILENL